MAAENPSADSDVQFPQRFLALMEKMKKECFREDEEAEVAETVINALKKFVFTVLDAFAPLFTHHGERIAERE